MDKIILSIQDISCVGQCSLTVALPIISACGIETAILPGALLSNHTASLYSGFTFKDLTEEMPKILERWNKENIFFDAFYTGYVTKVQIPYILEIMEKQQNQMLSELLIQLWQMREFYILDLMIIFQKKWQNFVKELIIFFQI